LLEITGLGTYTTTIVEANVVETRKGLGRDSDTDTPREIETETGSVTQTAQAIETGIVAATETREKVIKAVKVAETSNSTLS
jgi:hypothetical protein